MDQSFTPVITAVLGLVTTLVMGGIKKLSQKIDELPSMYKQLIVALIAFGVTKLSTLLGIVIPSDPTVWSAELVQSILTALAALGLHNVKKTTLSTEPK